MRIDRIEVYGYDLRYAHGEYVMSGGRTIASLASTLVRVIADSGAEGWGETCPLGPTYLEAHAGGARAALRELVPALLGTDPRNLGAVNDAMDQALRGHAGYEAVQTIHGVARILAGVFVAELGDVSRFAGAPPVVLLGRPDTASSRVRHDGATRAHHQARFAVGALGGGRGGCAPTWPDEDHG